MYTLKKVVAAYYNIILTYEIYWLDIVLNVTLQKSLLAELLLPNYRQGFFSSEWLLPKNTRWCISNYLISNSQRIFTRWKSITKFDICLKLIIKKLERLLSNIFIVNLEQFYLVLYCWTWAATCWQGYFKYKSTRNFSYKNLFFWGKIKIAWFPLS